ncbi:MAG: hypothetical protein GY838_11865 [bacterium]|nr:hypothetical protein [bacterium]
MKSRQFCSVCKQHLEMEVVPTGDGDDDGVVWFRCPKCQGFLPKLGGALEEEADGTGETSAEDTVDTGTAPDEPEAGTTTDTGSIAEQDEPADDMPWDSPADMLASRSAEAVAEPGPEAATKTPETNKKDGAADKAQEPPEPIAEYASLLAGKDPSEAEPYRPWQTYEVGQCVHHLAWDDCGVVVAKEDLPGGRHVIKCYFSEAGVVRLIEQAPR